DEARCAQRETRNRVASRFSAERIPDAPARTPCPGDGSVGTSATSRCASLRRNSFTRIVPPLVALMRQTIRVLPLLRFELRPEPLLALAQLGRECFAEILGGVDRPDLDLGLFRHRIGAPLDPLDRMVERVHFPQPVARDKLARRRE